MPLEQLLREQKDKRCIGMRKIAALMRYGFIALHGFYYEKWGLRKCQKMF